MTDLDLIRESLPVVDKVFKYFETSYGKSTHRHIRAWRECAYNMRILLEKELDIACYFYIRKDRTCALYELNYDGAANIPQQHYSESEIEITVNLSPELYTRQLSLPEGQWDKYKEQFVLTFIHEMTHSLQFDDEKIFFEDYFSSPFEIDAYSSELAFDRFLYKREEKACDSYARYATIDNKIQKQMISLARKKYSYLKNNK